MSELSDLAFLIGMNFEHPSVPDCPVCADVERAAAAVIADGYRKEAAA